MSIPPDVPTIVPAPEWSPTQIKENMPVSGSIGAVICRISPARSSKQPNLSAHVCEVCGAPGALQNDGGWLTTAAGTTSTDRVTPALFDCHLVSFAAADSSPCRTGGRPLVAPRADVGFYLLRCDQRRKDCDAIGR